jgi:peptidoglycan/xylan/chitin deacetylase (PgdA/CDA1 family)
MIAGIPILLYHRVGPLDGSRMDRYTVSPERFLAQMMFLADAGWNIVSLEEFVARRTRRLPRKSAVITFDDGFSSNIKHAWPILAQFEFHATTFIVTEELGGTNSWDTTEMPRYPLLTSADLFSADPALMAFQSHSLSHASLPSLDDAALEREVNESRTKLEALAGHPITVFAYPFGSWSKRVRSVVRAAGYRAACSCRVGCNYAHTDSYLLRRVWIREADAGWRLHAKLLTGLNL